MNWSHIQRLGFGCRIRSWATTFRVKIAFNERAASLADTRILALASSFSQPTASTDRFIVMCSLVLGTVVGLVPGVE